MECMNIVGTGNTATIYEWGKGRVLKLFHKGYPKEFVENEFHNAMAIRNMNFVKPKAHEIISYEGKMGIVYDRVEGESLFDFVIKTGDVHKCAEYMAKLHKKILQNKISNVSSYKEFLKFHLLNASTVNKDRVEDALKLIYNLPDGNTLCHGDFHPGNIIISGGNAIVIDFMNVCCGNFLYDVARTVFLVEYTPVPEGADNRKGILSFKKTLADLYLLEMNVTRDMIADYLSVIILARKGECPNE